MVKLFVINVMFINIVTFVCIQLCLSLGVLYTAMPVARPGVLIYHHASTFSHFKNWSTRWGQVDHIGQLNRELPI